VDLIPLQPISSCLDNVTFLSDGPAYASMMQEAYGSISELFCYISVQLFAILKNGVFWDVTPCGSCKNQIFRGT
jgi:hypothetical protein